MLSALDDGNVDPEEKKYWVVDKDTGQVFRITDLDQHMNINQYSLFPTRDELQAMKSHAAESAKDSDDEGPTSRGESKH